MKTYVGLFALCCLCGYGIFYYIQGQSTAKELQSIAEKSDVIKKTELSTETESSSQREIPLQEETSAEEPVKEVLVKESSAPVRVTRATTSLSSSSSLQIKSEQNNERVDLLRQLIEFKTTIAELEEQGINTDKIIPKNITTSALVDLLEYRKTPYKNVTGFKPLPLRSSARDFGMFLVSTSKEVTLHMFDEQGLFSGIIQLGADGIGIPIEEIPGVDLYTFIDRGFMVTGGTGDVTVFINVLKTGIAQLYTRVGNGDLEPYFFPVSTQSKGSTTFIRSKDTIELMHWNIDVDGDGISDVSFGHTGPNEEQVRLMFDLIRSDSDLPKEERNPFSQKTVDIFVKSLDSKDGL
jgi:hypothetical protein